MFVNRNLPEPSNNEANMTKQQLDILDRIHANENQNLQKNWKKIYAKKGENRVRTSPAGFPQSWKVRESHKKICGHGKSWKITNLSKVIEK